MGRTKAEMAVAVDRDNATTRGCSLSLLSVRNQNGLGVLHRSFFLLHFGLLVLAIERDKNHLSGKVPRSLLGAVGSSGI